MSEFKLVYNVEDKPRWGKTIIFALQQLLSILAATILVPAIVGNGMSASAALLGAGVGTLVYLLLTRFRSPVFLGSSFAFLGSMAAAFAGAVSVSIGYVGLILGAASAGLVYVLLALIVKFAGTNWINKVMPAVVIGPIVAVIGLSLSGSAIGNLVKGSVPTTNTWLAVACGLFTLFVTINVSVFGKRFKMVPFIVGILAGYLFALFFTGIGFAAGRDEIKIINFELFKLENIEWYPHFTFLEAFKADFSMQNFGSYFATILIAYVPVAFVTFAEHLADHKNLSSIINRDLTRDPGLHRTLLGDGLGSMAGAFFGGCPNTTYGESIGTIALSRNASIRTIIVTAILAIVLSFIGPFATFLASIPNCVMGGISVALYGFIAVSGLKMLSGVDLNENKNILVISTILVIGVGGLTLSIPLGGKGEITITTVACALIVGILANALVNATEYIERGKARREKRRLAKEAKAQQIEEKKEEK